MFSGVNCPGLIEARRDLRELDGFPMFSGVNCPGLIEAASSGQAFQGD